MTRRASDRPWWRKERNAYFICLGGKQYNLGSDKDVAEERLLQLKLETKQREKERPVKKRTTLVLDIIEDFLEWCKTHRAPETTEFYREKSQSFIGHLKTKNLLDLGARELRPFHLQEWSDSHEDWKPGMKRQAIMSVQRVFNWAAKCGRLDRSPVRHVEKPPAGRRELVISYYPGNKDSHNSWAAAYCTQGCWK
jgi:hypothetical protein